MYDLFIKPYEDYTTFYIILEAIAAAAGICSVYLGKKNNIWVFPVGIVSTAIYIYVTFVSKVYGGMFINAYYTVMSLYGWWMWSAKRGTDHTKKILPITRMNARSWLYSLGFSVVNFFVFYFILSRYTDTPVPMWDAFTNALFFTGMLLMAKRKVESWIFWIVGDLIATGLYFYVGLGMTGAQYLVLTLLAVFAYFEWDRIRESQNNTSCTNA